MASTSRDATTATGKTIRIIQRKLFSLVPMNEKTYLCRELTFDEHTSYKKKSKLKSAWQSCRSALSRARTSITSRFRSPSRSPTGTRRRNLARSPLKPPTKSTTEETLLEDETLDDVSASIKSEMWSSEQSFNLKVPQASEQPCSSSKKDEAVNEDDNPGKMQEPWNLFGVLSFDHTPDNLDNSRFRTPSTGQAVENPTRSSSATTASAGSKNMNGIMSLVCHEKYLYVIGVLVKGVATTIVCRYPLKFLEGGGSRSRWEKICSLPNRRPYHASCIFFESIIVSGGGDWNCNPETLTSFVFLDRFFRTTWSKCNMFGDVIFSRRKHCVIACNSDYNIVMLGGENQHNEKLNCVEMGFSRFSDSPGVSPECQTLPPMNHARSSFAAVEHNDFIYAIGGCDQEKRTGRITIECYSYDRQQWTDLEGFDSGMRFIFGFEHKQTICIVGGDPRTCDLLKTTTETANPPRIVWESPPAIDLPVVDLDNSIATTAGIVMFKEHG